MQIIPEMFTSANIPLNQLNNPAVSRFLAKWTKKPTPSESSICLQYVFKLLEISRDWPNPAPRSSFLNSYKTPFLNFYQFRRTKKTLKDTHKTRKLHDSQLKSLKINFRKIQKNFQLAKFIFSIRHQVWKWDCTRWPNENFGKRRTKPKKGLTK